MRREHLSTAVGLALLVGVFLVSAVHVLTRPDAQDPVDGRKVIRFAHWQLESGLREALDELSREYEAAHPDVRVEQVLVPIRTYSQWLKTRLVGENATDIIQLPRELDDETLARFFLPVTAEIERPNPYNQGTAFAETAWRDTFVDGLAGNFSYRPTLLEYYGIPLSMFTVRIYYNRELWSRLLGDTPPPATYEDFRRLCRRASEAAAQAGLRFIPIAGSSDNGPILISRFVSSQTQRLARDLSPARTLRTTPVDINIAYLRGAWSVDTPAVTDALTLAREVSLLMQPGYEQLRHEDATFYFTQGRALMITSGSWDAPVFRSLCRFAIGVFEVPLPEPSHPRLGKNLLGASSEADSSTGMAFAVTRATPHRAEALDFLRFLTSREGNARFSRRSGWLPSVVDVEPPADLVPFLPRIEGHLPGFGLSFGNGPATNLVVNRNVNALVQPSGGVEKFRRAVADDLEGAARDDLARTSRNSLLNLTRQDVLFGGRRALSRLDPRDGALASRLEELTESQNQQESLRAWIEHELRRTAAR